MSIPLLQGKMLCLQAIMNFVHASRVTASERSIDLGPQNISRNEPVARQLYI
jgi:uncharacterized protein YeaC (DUF1315 family)